MKYIIMCGGYTCNWKTPKHFWTFRGEPIIKRTIRQLKENGIKTVYITTSEKCVPMFKGLGARVIPYESNNKPYEWVDCFYPTDKPVCYIFGDVVYSDEAIKTIINTQTDDIEFFASAPPFPQEYPKPYAEPFCFKVANQKKLRECVEKVKELNRLHVWARDPIAWELWQIIKGTPKNRIDYTNYTVINDYTCDMDWEQEKSQWGPNNI